MFLVPDLRALVCRPDSYTAVALRALGKDPEAVERAHASHLRGAVARALAGVRTGSTKNNPQGVDRATLLRACGRQHAVSIGDAFELEPQNCRQRPCPSCARARARVNAKTLVRAMDKRTCSQVGGVYFLFATLTQPKRRRSDETAREAVERMGVHWRALANDRATRADFARYFAGGLRTTETTFAAAGDEQRNGHGRVAFSGFHVHLHVLLEVRKGVDEGEAAAWLLASWLALVEGSSAAGQCIRRARAEDAEELCKYVTKPLEDCADKPAVLRELFGALHRVRLLQPFGQWLGRGERLGWRALGEEPTEPRGHWRRGPEVGELLRRIRHPIEGTTTSVYFRGHDPNDEKTVDAWEAWESIERACERRARDLPPAECTAVGSISKADSRRRQLTQPRTAPS